MSYPEKFTYKELKNQGDFLPCRFYHPKSLYSDNGELLTEEDKLNNYIVTNDQIHLAQYKESRAKIIECKNCGNRNFTVAVEHYYTAIKCPNCGWERCIHEG